MRREKFWFLLATIIALAIIMMIWGAAASRTFRELRQTRDSAIEMTLTQELISGVRY